MNIGKVATVRGQLYGGFSTGQYRIYGDIFCMCIDIGYVGTGENKGSVKLSLLGSCLLKQHL